MPRPAPILAEGIDPELLQLLASRGYPVQEGPDEADAPGAILLAAGPQLPSRLRQLRAEHPRCPALVVGDDPGAERVAEAMRAGAMDWLLPPVDEGRLLRAVEQALLRHDVAAEGQRVLRQLEERGRAVEGERRLAGQRTRAVASELEHAHRALEVAHDELRGRVSQLVMLYTIGRDLSRERNWDEALANFLRNLTEFLGADGAALMLCSRGGRHIAARSVHGLPAELVRGAADALVEHHAALEDDPQLYPLEELQGAVPVPCAERQRPWRTTVVPLRHRGGALGYLLLGKEYRGERELGDDFYFLITIQTILTEEVAGAQAVGELRKLQRFHERTLDHVSNAILTVDAEGRVLYCNRPASQLLGGEVEGLDLGDRLRVGAERTHLAEWLAAADDDSGRAVADGWVLEGDDSAVPVSAVAVRLPGEMPGEKHWALIVEDLRERRQLEAERRRAARQDELLIMAAEWAHDVRTPLTGILHSAELLADALGADAPKRRHFDVIGAEVERIDALVSNFLDFARPARLKTQVTPLGPLVAQCHALMQGAAVRQGKRLQLADGAGELQAAVDPDQLKQVLLNLINNALDASPEGGTVVLRLAEELGARELEGSSPLAPAAVLQVEDEGPGVHADHLDRLFIPFFTTKSKGTGLGLAISEKIVRAHRGRLRYLRRSGRTIMRIVLPARPGEGAAGEGGTIPLKARG